MNEESSEELDAGRCPLCHQPNHCQLCTESAYKGPCWCMTMKIPDALLAQVPPHLRNQSCICKACVMDFHRRQKITAPQPLQPDDFYFEPGGLLVFTAEYHLRRGFCCDSGCRHCPYKN